MNLRTILYIFTLPIVVWTIDCLNIDRFFKQGRIWQIRLFYLLLVLSLSYLTVNFFYDFYLSTQGLV